MIIRCHGARGSIPVSGMEYGKYGGDYTCFEIRSKNSEIIVVDAGSGIRRLGDKLLSEERYNYSIIFTHSHFDHILGFPFFSPIYKEKTMVNISINHSNRYMATMFITAWLILSFILYRWIL